MNLFYLFLDLNRNSPCECSENHVVVGEILELKSAPSDMNTPKLMSIDGNWNPDSEASQVTGGYSIGFFLTVLQVIRVCPCFNFF